MAACCLLPPDRFFRKQLKLRAWRFRAEKLASHYAKALAAGNEELVQRFQSKGVTQLHSVINTPLQHLSPAAEDVDYQLVLRCLRESEDVNRKLGTGMTPLFEAAQAGQRIEPRKPARSISEVSS